MRFAWSGPGLVALLVLAGCSHPVGFDADYAARATPAISAVPRGARLAAAAPVHRVVARSDEDRTQRPLPEQDQDLEPIGSGADSPTFIRPFSPEWWEKENQDMERLRHLSRICRAF